jgi:hypothetical protein
MPSITTWTRIEPDIQRNEPLFDLTDGLAAKLADPFWMLGRQWQMGELTGEDAASPVVAQINASSFPIDSLQLGTKVVRYSATATPTEAVVEGDAGKTDTRTQASGGAILIDRLAEANLDPAYRTKLLQNYALDPSTPDGDAVLAAQDAHRLVATLGVTVADQTSFDTVMKAWAAWYRERRPRPNVAWVPDRLEYRFSAIVNVTEGKMTLAAPEHTGDRIDWDTFTASMPQEGASVAPVRTSLDVAPIVLHIPGMPALTFWEMEDPRFDPGRIEAGPSDTARLLLVETALAYASDWFLLPLRLPVAAMSKIDSLTVTDTFGVKTVIGPVEQVRPSPGWRLWKITDFPYLFLPPPNTGFITADPVEKVVFVRDEAANIAWALQALPQAPPAVPDAVPADEGDLTYIPITSPPDDRVPLVLEESATGRTLVRGKLTGQKTGPQGTLVSTGFKLRDEELPDEGLTLERRYELGRTPDGVLHMWISKVKRTGARLPSSGLTCDRMQQHAST